MEDPDSTALVADIELEAFEVGLGSSIYLRLRASDGDVRILADGGAGRGFDDAHVLRKLDALLAREGGERRVDLVIGTHYDEDHLRGLVPVLESGVAVGEVWLPPVLDDTAEIVADAATRRTDALGARFEADEGAFPRYLDAKVEEVARVGELERALGVEATVDEGPGGRPPDGAAGSHAKLAWLRTRLLPDEAMCGCEHFDVADVPRPRLPEPFGDLVGWPPGGSGSLFRWRLRRDFGRLLSHAAEIRGTTFAAAAVTSLGFVRNAAAKDAISAAALDEVIRAARDRKAGICFLTIPRGRPRDFRWDRRRRRFAPGSPRSPGEPSLTLLGPSDELA